MSDIKLANCLESKFIFQKDFIITMNNVDKIYKKKLLENGVKGIELSSSCKTSKNVATRKSAKFGCT